MDEMSSAILYAILISVLKLKTIMSRNHLPPQQSAILAQMLICSSSDFGNNFVSPSAKDKFKIEEYSQFGLTLNLEREKEKNRRKKNDWKNASPTCDTLPPKNQSHLKKKTVCNHVSIFSLFSQIVSGVSSSHY